MDTLENLRSKIEGAQDLGSVVSAMKAMAGSNIIQYETAVTSLVDYYHTIVLGLVGYFKAEKIDSILPAKKIPGTNKNISIVIVFGSDQGLVGQFNDSLAGFISRSLKSFPGKKEIWVVGERIELLLADEGFDIVKSYSVPSHIHAVTPLITEILNRSTEAEQKGTHNNFYIFHNQPQAPSGYQAVLQRFLPLDEEWKRTLQQINWPTALLPEIAGSARPTLAALINEYLFSSLFKACAESLASENASRLEAMQRAEKKIAELLEELSLHYHRLRQSSIDEELFDIISGFEALKAK